MGTNDQTPDHNRFHTWAPIVAVAVGSLLLGFAGGWLIRGDGGEATVLMAAGEQDGSAPDATAPPRAAPDPAPEAQAPAQSRAQLEVTVLNGSGQTGLAGRVAEQLRDSGYGIAVADNGPDRAGPSVVYFIAGRRPEAQRLRADLQLSTPVQPLADGPVRDISSESTDLVVLLGAG